MDKVTRLVFARHQQVRPIDTCIRKYRYEPSGRARWPFRWFARLREWLWFQWSEQFFETIETIRVSVTEETIFEAIQNANCNIEDIWYKRVHHVLLGPRQLHLALEAASHSSFSMQLELSYAGVRQLFGLRVHLIPWFDGCLLLPDLEGMPSK